MRLQVGSLCGSAVGVQLTSAANGDRSTGRCRGFGALRSFFFFFFSSFVCRSKKHTLEWRMDGSFMYWSLVRTFALGLCSLARVSSSEGAAAHCSSLLDPLSQFDSSSCPPFAMPTDSSPSVPAVTAAAAAAACAGDSPLWVSHRCRRSGRALRPWIVHVWQGKPAHQDDAHDQSAETLHADAAATATPTGASSLESCLAQTGVAAAAPLPFAAPTSKAGHDEHDLRALSPEQAAAYANEYGKVEQAEEIGGVLRRLRYRDDEQQERALCQSVIFHQVSLASVDRAIAALQAQQAQLDERRRQLAHDAVACALVPELVVMNLCDGTEDDGYPGITIARQLEQTMRAEAQLNTSSGGSSNSAAVASVALRGLYHTGADPAFFNTTTEKTTMKACFDISGVRSSRFVDLSDVDTETPVDEQSVYGGSHANLFAALQPSSLYYPLIIKPTSSYSSCGLSHASVVSTPFAALVQAQKISRELGRVLAEEFVIGREFSMLIVGDWDGDKQQDADHGAASSAAAAASAASSATPAESSPSSVDPYPHLRCYTAAERAFTASLPAEQQFLTFEQNYPTQHTQVHTWWSPLDVRNNETHAREQAAMAALAKRAYVACRGRSYGRIDLRQMRRTGEFFCLEVNSLPGLSGELDSSVGAILSMAQPATSFGHFLYAILFLAVHGRLDELPAEGSS